MTDPINPDYYKHGGLEAIEVIEALFPDSFHLATAFKYMARAGLKDDEQQDISKAIWYLERYKKFIAKEHKVPMTDEDWEEA